MAPRNFLAEYEKYIFIFCVPFFGGFNGIIGYIRAVLLGDLDDSIPAINMLFYLIVYALIMLSQKRFLQYDFTEEFAFLKSSGWKSLLYAAIFNVAAQIMSFIAQPYITPVVNAILSQILVPILMVLSAIMFSTRYIFLEILGVVIIIMADIITSVVTVSDKSDEAASFWVVFWMIMSSVMQGFSWVYKERCFREFKQAHNRTILLFPALVLIQAFGMISVFPMLWVTESLRGKDFWAHIVRTLCAFTHYKIMIAYLAYIFVNLLFNIAIYRLLSISTSVLPFISLKFQLPLVALLSLFDWPYIGRKTPSTWNLFELIMLVFGISFYLYGGVLKKKLKTMDYERLCCWMGFFVNEVKDEESIPLLNKKTP